VLLVGETSKLRNETSIAFLLFVGAAASYGLGEFLITQYRLYRFGIEEAFLAVAGFLVVFGAGIFASTWHLARPGPSSILVGLIAGSGAAFAIYLRFGHVYVALASMLCMAAAPFQMGVSRESQRLASAVLLLLVFIIARRKRLQASPDFPADEYSVIQA